MKLFDLKQMHKGHLDTAQSLLTAAETAGRPMTGTEQFNYDVAMSSATATERNILAIESNNSLAGQFGPKGPLVTGRELGHSAPRSRISQKPMTEEYSEAFLALLRSGGKQAGSALSEGFDPMFGGFALPSLPGMNAALYEGSSGAGGFSVSVPTDSQIVPLGMVDLGVRSVARVIPTATDIKIPVGASFGVAGIKSESGASTNTFTESDPSLSQFTLTAWMVGLTHTVSWELLQDVPLFQSFGITDLLNAISITEDGFFVSGTGTGQPQGLLGNVGTGTAAAYTVDSAGLYLLQSTIDVLGTLKSTYYANAGWLMSRQTGAAIRKAQIQANLFAPVWTRENGRDFLHGYPVAYSGTMPALPTATTAGVTPILFGSFADGYLIGDRGGSGTYVKILDQPLATSGQTILLGYKRVDGRVRRSEAIQQISVAHS